MVGGFHQGGRDAGAVSLEPHGSTAEHPETRREGRQASGQRLGHRPFMAGAVQLLGGGAYVGVETERRAQSFSAFVGSLVVLARQRVEGQAAEALGRRDQEQQPS